MSSLADTSSFERYRQAYSYLSQSAELQRAIKENFILESKSSMMPDVSDTVVFSGFAPLCLDKKAECPLNLSVEERDGDIYSLRHRFDFFVESRLEGLGEESSNLLMVFSKPVRNFLVAVIYSKRSWAGPGRYYAGRALKVVFVFDEHSNTVKMALFTGMDIN